MATRDPRECAKLNTVVAAPLPPDSVAAALPLARSAVAAGFACVVVQPFDATTASAEPLLLALPPPPRPLLPRSRWCNRSADYNRRRIQFHRMLLWRTLLERGLSVIGVDASARLLRDPLQAIDALRTRGDEQYGSGARPDMLGSTPGWFLKEYYLHHIFLRATPVTLALLRRAEARTFGISDQSAFTEELNWGAGSNATCCHTNCLTAQFTTQPVVKPPKRAAVATTTCAHDDAPPLAPPPPNASRHVWKAGQWRTNAYNDLKIPFHRFGRCTGRDVSCEPAAMHASCPPAPPPFTREIAVKDRARAAAARGGGDAAR